MARFLPPLALLFCCGCVGLFSLATVPAYGPPPDAPGDEVADDRLGEQAPAFDDAVVDRRPYGEFQLNASAAVLRLDAPPFEDEALLALHPSYRKAWEALGHHGEVLPSASLIDAKARQFDDGLCACLELAYYRGLPDRLTGHVELVRALYDCGGPASPAAPFLAAGLELAGVYVDPGDAKAKQEFLRQFHADEVASKPTGFYTWNDDLKACFRFLRFFRKPFDLAGPVPAALVSAFAKDAHLLAGYRKALHFYARLTNPPQCASIADLMDGVARKPRVALFPASASREGALFEKVFPQGLPPDGDVMSALLRNIRSGKVSLAPDGTSGWYDRQAYALETLLLPEKGPERDKLQLTAAYKKRLLGTFKSMRTMHLDTHLRQVEATPPPGSPTPPVGTPAAQKFAPRLRLEPCLSYYLRAARAYAFLATFLDAAVGREQLEKLHGLRQGKPREPNLWAELAGQRDLFYGFYLVAAEDVGLKPSFALGEAVDVARCYKRATDWLPRARFDPDLAADARVAPPVAVGTKGTRLWATLGVRAARLEAAYARPPHVCPKDGGTWEAVTPDRLGAAAYLILVDDVAEIPLAGRHTLTREEWRAACDRCGTREAVLKALR
jgi:hypothetical protein